MNLTFVEGLLLGAVSVFYCAEEVMWAVGGTALVTWSLTLFALQTKFDFTSLSGLLWTLFFVLILYGSLCLFLRSYWLHLIYANLGTLVFSVVPSGGHTAYTGRSHQCDLSPEEYIFANLNLYPDITSILIFVLQLFHRVLP